MSSVEAVGYLKPQVVFVEAAHVKANANLKKKVKKAIPSTTKTYEQQLFEEVNQDREARDKKPWPETTKGTGGQGIDDGSGKRSFS